MAKKRQSVNISIELLKENIKKNNKERDFSLAMYKHAVKDNLNPYTKKVWLNAVREYRKIIKDLREAIRRLSKKKKKITFKNK